MTQNKKPLAFVMGVTANLAFSAGVALLQLGKHMPGGDYEVLIYHQGLEDRDAALLSALPRCRLVEYSENREFLRRTGGKFPPALLYRFEIFQLLEEYKCAVWLDSDISIQGDLSGLAAYGPFSLAMDQNSSSLAEVERGLLSNFSEPIPGYDMQADFYNAGVMVVRDDLVRARELYDWCFMTMARLGDKLSLRDQSVLNLMLQKFPEIFQELPHAEYNCHPVWPTCYKARLVHCFGSLKPWNNSLIAAALPDWRREYDHWLNLGGSAYTGSVKLPEFMELSTFGLIYSLAKKTLA